MSPSRTSWRISSRRSYAESRLRSASQNFGVAKAESAGLEPASPFRGPGFRDRCLTIRRNSPSCSNLIITHRQKKLLSKGADGVALEKGEKDLNLPDTFCRRAPSHSAISPKDSGAGGEDRTPDRPVKSR